MIYEKRLIPTVEIWPNTGQINGLPANPRFIRDERGDALFKSIQDDPEMLDLRECIVFPYADAFVAIAGNMRLAQTINVINMDIVSFCELMATKKQEQIDKGLDYGAWFKAITELRTTKSIPCKILPADTPIEKLKAIVIKDNVGFGQDNWDLLNQDWDITELEDFGMITMDFATAEENEQEDFESSLPEDSQVDLSPSAPPIELKIVFDDLQVFDSVKLEIEELLKGYPDAKLKL